MKKFILLIVIATSSVQVFQAQQTSIGDTLSAFNAGILTATPDRSLIGVEFIDGHYWVTGSDPDDGYNHKLYKIRADDQTLVETFEYGLEFAGWSDLAYDGDYLYVADIDTIRQIDIATGQKTGIKIPAPEYYLNGLAYDPASDHFWVSGDGNIIYEVDRDGEIINAISFIPDLPAAGLAWDTWTEGGPYLWVWSMKYTPDDVRPRAIQINPATGLPTGLEFEGVVMHPGFPSGADYALGATISDEVIEDKVTFIGMHGSSYMQNNDQLDWIVNYDLDPEGTGIPGPVISVNPSSIENDLYPGETTNVEIFVQNLSDSYILDWSAKLEYPGENDQAELGDTLQSFNASLLTPDTNTFLRGIAYIGDYIFINSGLNFNKQFQLYQFEKDGSTLVDVDTLYSAFSGWTAMTSDDQYIYGARQYSIQVFDPINDQLVDTYFRPNFSPNAMAYDPQKELFYLGNSIGAVMTTNKEGDEVNFYVIPYPIEGLSWDNTSPGGPFLWVYYQVESGLIKAVRLNPDSGAETGVTFEGINLSNDPDDADQAKGIMVTPAWQENKLVMFALHDSNDSIDDGNDKVVVYDLDIVPPPGWIDLIGDSYGNVAPLSTDTLTVKLDAIMEDTLMMAQIAFSSNDVSRSEVLVPVNFMMLPLVTGEAEIEIVKEESSFRVYPNPVSTFLKIDIKNETTGGIVHCYNSNGNLLFRKTIFPNETRSMIDLSGLSAGLYIIVLQSENAVDSQVIIKE